MRYAVETVKQNLLRMGSNFEKAGLTEEKVREDFRSASEKRVKEHLASLRSPIKGEKGWCAHQRKGIEKAKALVLSMERSSGD
jgi:hypothetical protein